MIDANAGRAAGANLGSTPRARPAVRVRRTVHPALVAFPSAAAGAIHVVAALRHLDEGVLYVAFFAALAAFQLVWAVTILKSANRRTVLAAAAVDALAIATWIVSRTTGLPIGAHALQPESAGADGLLASALEALVVAISVAALADADLRFIASGDRDRRARAFRRTAISAWAAVLVAASAASIWLSRGAEATHASDAAHASHHLSHVLLIGAAAVVFALYVAVDVWRNGWPRFSWRLRVAA